MLFFHLFSMQELVTAIILLLIVPLNALPLYVLQSCTITAFKYKHTVIF